MFCFFLRIESFWTRKSKKKKLENFSPFWPSTFLRLRKKIKNLNFFFQFRFWWFWFWQFSIFNLHAFVSFLTCVPYSYGLRKCWNKNFHFFFDFNFDDFHFDKFQCSLYTLLFPSCQFLYFIIICCLSIILIPMWGTIHDCLFTYDIYFVMFIELREEWSLFDVWPC